MVHVEEPAPSIPEPASKHTEGEQVKASYTLTKGGLHLGNKRKSRRDLDNDALPTGCGTLGRRQEKADSPALIIGISPSSFVSLNPADGGSEPGNQLLPVLSLSSCWCSCTCVSHAGSGSACFYRYPWLLSSPSTKKVQFHSLRVHKLTMPRVSEQPAFGISHNS
jgi:hypothetical protein